MQTLNDKEKRTIRYGAIALSIYLLAFYGKGCLGGLETQRDHYATLTQEVREWDAYQETLETKRLLLEKMRGRFALDLASVSSSTLVADTSAAIQSTLQASGFQIGPVRESPGRATSHEAAFLRFETTGPAKAALLLIHRLERVGFPILIDSLQMKQDPKKPGMMELTFQVVVLDYSRWKQEDTRHG